MGGLTVDLFAYAKAKAQERPQEAQEEPIEDDLDLDPAPEPEDDEGNYLKVWTCNTETGRRRLFYTRRWPRKEG